MRTALPLILVAVVAVLSLTTRARGEDPAPAAADTLEARLELLTREVDYLRSREARLTTYVLGNGARAEALAKLVDDLRAGGFAAAANPSPTRERLLQGLAAMAEGLKVGLPTLSDSDRSLLATFPR